MKYCWMVFIVMALMMPGCASKPEPRPLPAPPVKATQTPPKIAPPKCNDCGVVERIDVINTATGSAPSGEVLGGVIGGILNAPSVESAPAAPTTSTTKPNQSQWQSYAIHVRLLNGQRIVIRQFEIPKQLQVGSRVRTTGGRLVIVR